MRLSFLKKKNATAPKTLATDTKTAFHNPEILNQPVDQKDAIVGKIIIDIIDPDFLEKWKMCRNMVIMTFYH